ncbi:hypothetical protein VPH35_019950 [Triticum aestivum]
MFSWFKYFLMRFPVICAYPCGWLLHLIWFTYKPFAAISLGSNGLAEILLFFSKFEFFLLAIEDQISYTLNGQFHVWTNNLRLLSDALQSLICFQNSVLLF